MYFSPKKNAFYHRDIHGDSIPSDAVFVDDEDHQKLLRAQSQGLKIVAQENGFSTTTKALNIRTTSSLKKMVTKKRWEVETGGLTLPNGVSVATGIDDQNRITSVIANARLAALETVSFKAASGWVTLTLAELESVAATIALHVQQCFCAERAHYEAIDALDALYANDVEALRKNLEAYDIEQKWPFANLPL